VLSTHYTGNFLLTIPAIAPSHASEILLSHVFDFDSHQTHFQPGSRSSSPSMVFHVPLLGGLVPVFLAIYYTIQQRSINASNVADRDHFAFGAGRRVCPGYHVAERSLAVSIMRILWSFNVTVAPRAKLPLDPQDFPGFMPGSPGATLPACLVVRSPDRKKIIEKCWEETKAGMRTSGRH
jgi:hypothetical protein